MAVSICSRAAGAAAADTDTQLSLRLLALTEATQRITQRITWVITQGWLEGEVYLVNIVRHSGQHSESDYSVIAPTLRRWQYWHRAQCGLWVKVWMIFWGQVLVYTVSTSLNCVPWCQCHVQCCISWGESFCVSYVCFWLCAWNSTVGGPCVESKMWGVNMCLT